MSQSLPRPTADGPDMWLARIFAARAVADGGVVRRSIAWVDREVGRDRLVTEVRRRGFHMVECGGQFIIICNREGMRLVC